MSSRFSLAVVVAAICAAVVLVSPAHSDPDKKPEVPTLKFDEVKELAPGVFFRYSSISATDPKVVFGGSNHTWVLFKDHVVGVDANFPKEAADVVAAIRKTTKLPIKYVLDTHHHGDHAYGNAVWAKEGAKIVAQKNAARMLLANGPKQWEEQARERKDVRESHLHQVDESFDEKLILDDGTQRIEFLYLGHAHTRGDAVAYLPKHKILCTGDACVNGAFNFMGHSNSAEWIKCLEKMEKLDIDYVCPGHGPVAGKDLIAKQKRYFVELRAAVKKGIDEKKSLEDITAGLEMAWYKEWTGKAAKDIKDNVKHVYDEMTGKIDHEKLGARPRAFDLLAMAE